MDYDIVFKNTHYEVTFYNKTTAGIIAACIRELVKHKDWSNDRKLLLDYRQADLSHLDAKIKKELVSRTMIEYKEHYLHVKAVDVFSDESDIEMAKEEKDIRKSYDDETDSHYFATTSYDEAVRWLLEE